MKTDRGIELTLRTNTNSIVFGGDTSLGDYYLDSPKWSHQHARLLTHPASFFDGVKGLISHDDFAVLNFESVLLKDRQTASPLDKDYPGWDDPSRTIPVLKDMNVGAVNLANNHTKDFGAANLTETMGLLNQDGISTFGAGGNSQQARLPLILHKGNSRLYVFAAMQYRKRYQDELNYYATAIAPGINLLDDNFLKAITEVRKGDPAAVIVVCPHWGVNYRWSDEGTRQLSKELVSAGADLIIGHGSHMLGECFAGHDGIRILSLGNFVFNSPGRYEKHGAPPFSLVAKLPLPTRFDRSDIQVHLYPIVSDNRLTEFRPRTVTHLECEKVYELLLSVSDDKSEFLRRFELRSDENGFFIKTSNS